MKLGGKLFIVLFLQFITLSLANQNLVPVFISEMGSFLQTSFIQTVMEDSVLDCVLRCVGTLNCRSINYRTRGNGNNCFLNSKNRREASEAAMIHHDNFIHYDIDYHTQISEEAEFGPAVINVPTVPTIVAAESPGPCNTNPCLNGGTCTEIMGENRFECNCTDTFTGDTCEQLKPTAVTPAPQDDYDFELVFRTKSKANYVLHIFPDNYFNEVTVCTWVYAPDIMENQKRAVWSLKDASTKTLTAYIDVMGGFFFSWGGEWVRQPNHFSESAKNGWIYLCVAIFINVNSNLTVEAIVNANYSSKVSSTDITRPFQNTKITKMVIGQTWKSGGFNSQRSFKGRIADLNIWNWKLDEFHVNKWYRGTARDEPPILAWSTLGHPDNRFGDVHFVSITSAFNGRGWRNIKASELVINTTSEVMVATAVNGSDEEDFEVSISTIMTCTDVNTALAVAAFIAVPGNWARIKFRQTFNETQHCYAIFGNVPTWAPSNFPDPGIEEFDPGKDEILKEKYLGGINVHHYSGVNTLCGEDHFWAVNDRHPYGEKSEAEISLRRKTGAQTAGISTYGKCGQFSFKIKDIQVLEI